jgi:hypothetical protein
MHCRVKTKKPFFTFYVLKVYSIDFHLGKKNQRFRKFNKRKTKPLRIDQLKIYGTFEICVIRQSDCGFRFSKTTKLYFDTILKLQLLF